MRVRRSIASANEAPEELPPSRCDSDRVLSVFSADWAISGVSDEVHGVSFGAVLLSKLQQVVISGPGLNQHRGYGDAVRREPELPGEQRVEDDDGQSPDQTEL